MCEDEKIQKVNLTKRQEQLSMFGEKMLREKMLNLLEAFYWSP